MLLSIFLSGFFSSPDVEEKKMKTLLVYCSRKGYVKEWGERLASKAGGSVTMAEAGDKDLTGKIREHDAVVIAASLKAGSVDSRIKKLCTSGQKEFSGKKIVIALAGIGESDSGKFMTQNFPAELLEKAEAKIWIGGRYIPEQNNFLVRFIMKKITGSSGNVNCEKWETVDEVIKILEGSR